MRFSTLGLLGSLAFTLTAAGCSSSSHGGSQLACNPCDGDASSAAPAAGGHNANPDGVSYPSPASGYGSSARSGRTPGSVMANFKFLGYPNGDKSNGLVPIALADYYDPCQKRLKLLHLTVAGVWCEPCNEETDAIVAAKSELDSEGVVVIQALDDGPMQGVPATRTDLDDWVGLHSSNFTEMLDPGLQNLGGFFDAAAIPWNCDLDPRTMEIIDEGVGWAGSVDVELQPAIASVQAAPLYPLPVSCTN